MLTALERRLIDITYQEKLSHLSSTLSALPIIDDIYNKKREDDIFILSNGHAGLALYVVLEDRYGFDAVSLFHKHGIHPNKDPENKIYCSTGSLGSGLPIAVGHALARPDIKVFCMISDGECAEGSIWESLSFIHQYPVKNIEVYANINGQGAYDAIDSEYLTNRLKSFMPRINICLTKPPAWKFASDLLSHYYVLKQDDYEEICK